MKPLYVQLMLQHNRDRFEIISFSQGLARIMEFE